MTPEIKFVPLAPNHIVLILKWLKQPHVSQFWQESKDDSEVETKYLTLLKERGVSPYLIELDGQLIGYIQSYEASKIGGGWWVGYPDGVFGIDQFIGEPSLIGKGIGTQVISKFVELLCTENQVREIIADPVPENPRAIRAYEKAGFIRGNLVETPGGKAILMKFTP